MDITQQSEPKRELAPILLFASTLFISASLMFVLQPMFGKVLLPLLGGAPSVWNTCMVFYQSILFVGYLYAHLISTQQKQNRQILIHGVIMLASCLSLPIALSGNTAPPTESDPTLWLLSILAASIGLPFFVISTTAPLLQKWFSTIGHQTSHDPYYLYAASNAGSLIALLSYPFLLEPNIGLQNQLDFWSIGYLLLSLAIMRCMIYLRRMETAGETTMPATKFIIEKPDKHTLFHWLALSFVPSSLLLALTNFISTDIAAVPLLWVIPLGLYLLAFILVFSKFGATIHPSILALQPWIITPLIVYLSYFVTLSHQLTILSIHFLGFFVSVMVCLGELAKRRPSTQYLTSYYLIMSLGGMLGGLFNTFIAPLIFNSIFEYPLMLAAALLLRPHKATAGVYHKIQLPQLVLPVYVAAFALLLYFTLDDFSQYLLVGAVVTLAAINFYVFHKNLVHLILYSAVIVSCTNSFSELDKRTLYKERSFYGVLSVKQEPIVNENGETEIMHRLYSGSIEHGSQRQAGAYRCDTIGYYNRLGPIGQLFTEYGPHNRFWRIGVVGLGSGGLSAYAKPDQYWTFYELDPHVVELAKDPDYFSFLKDCAENYRIIVGDGRLALDQAKNHQFDLLILDAFTSDSVPTHLMTREAVALYFSNLKPDGILVFHISNRHLALQHVLADHAQQLGFEALIQTFRPGKEAPLAHRSDWVVAAKELAPLEPLLHSDLGKWQKLRQISEINSWTDDFTSIVSIWK